MSLLHDAFARAKSENRAALIAYLPAGYPSEDGAVECIAAMVEGGVDIVEIGFPYSDPVMDGPTIQDAVNISLEGGTKSATVINTVKRVADLGVPALVMSYWNPIERYGVDSFASDSPKPQNPKFTTTLKVNNLIHSLKPFLASSYQRRTWWSSRRSCESESPRMPS